MTATSKKKSKKKTKKTAAKKTTSKKKVAKKVAKKATTRSAKVSKKSKKVTKKTTSKKTTKKTTSKKATKKTTKKTAPRTRVAKKKTASRRSTAVDADGLIHGIAPYKAKRNEEYMGTEQCDHFRHILRGWRGELVHEINRTIHTMQDETVNHPDPSDRATQETDISLELRSRDRERKLIRKIDETLATIDSGDYGFCEKCGVEIGIARLEARPTANQCIDCKTLDEIREKQMN